MRKRIIVAVFAAALLSLSLFGCAGEAPPFSGVSVMTESEYFLFLQDVREAKARAFAIDPETVSLSQRGEVEALLRRVNALSKHADMEKPTILLQAVLESLTLRERVLETCRIGGEALLSRFEEGNAEESEVDELLEELSALRADDALQLAELRESLTRAKAAFQESAREERLSRLIEELDGFDFAALSSKSLGKIAAYLARTEEFAERAEIALYREALLNAGKTVEAIIAERSAIDSEYKALTEEGVPPVSKRSDVEALLRRIELLSPVDRSECADQSAKLSELLTCIEKNALDMLRIREFYGIILTVDWNSFGADALLTVNECLKLLDGLPSGDAAELGEERALILKLQNYLQREQPEGESGRVWIRE